MLAALRGRAAVGQRRGAAPPAIEGGYDEGYAGGGFGYEPRASSARPARLFCLSPCS
jgi:hypothetical protein